VSEIDGETARGLLHETKDTIAEKIRPSTNPGAIGGPLRGVRLIDEGTAKWLEKETKFKGIKRK